MKRSLLFVAFLAPKPILRAGQGGVSTSKEKMLTQERVRFFCAAALIALVLPAGRSMAQTSPPQGYVAVPEAASCSFRDLTQTGGASTGGKWVLSSVGSLVCGSKEVGLTSGAVSNRMLSTKSFGDLFIGGGGSSLQLYIRSDELNAFMSFVQGAGPVAPAAAGSAKIAVIAFQLAVAQTNEGQRDFTDLQKKYSPKETALKSLSGEIDKLTKELQDQGANLSQVERSNRAKTIDDKKKQLDRETEDARNEFQQDMQDLYNSLASKVYDVMQSYAEQQGFTLVLDVSQQQSPVLYANNGTNITKQVIDAYNLKSGVPAPAPQSSTEAPKPKPAAPAAKPTTSAPKPATTH